MPRYSYRAIHLDRLAEHRTRRVPVAGRVAVEEHLRVPAADLRLLTAERYLVRLTQCGREMLLGVLPIAPRGRRDPGKGLGQMIGVPRDERPRGNRCDRARIQFGGSFRVAKNGEAVSLARVDPTRVAPGRCYSG